MMTKPGTLTHIDVAVRPETPADYAAIAAVHARAFDGRAFEPSVVALQRQQASFDPALSLVAEVEGRVVGHALFSPVTVRLLGEDVRAVNLAPIAVDPATQGRGIGGALIEEGHTAARERGYALAFLLGHPTYYPRFGYRTHAYGASSVTATGPAAALDGLSARPLAEDDVPALRALFVQAEGAVDFAAEPGPGYLDWVSPNPAIRSVVFVRDGRLVGYARIHRDEPLKPHYFLAADADSARGMVAHLRMEAGAAGPVDLPLHPYSAAAGAFDAPRCDSWEASMAFSLVVNPFDAYNEQVRAGGRVPGRVLWPVCFDLS